MICIGPGHNLVVRFFCWGKEEKVRIRYMKAQSNFYSQPTNLSVILGILFGCFAISMSRKLTIKCCGTRDFFTEVKRYTYILCLDNYV